MFFAWYNNLDKALTEFFAKVWSYFTWQNFVFILTGIVMGFVLCMGVYSLIVMYSVKQEAKNNPVIDPDDEELNKLVDEIKARYKEDSVGMSVKEKAVLLGNAVYDTINIIAGHYYPNSKYPIYELSIEETLHLMQYLYMRINHLFSSSKIITRFKGATVSQIFRLIETKKKIDEKKAVQAAKRLKLNKISQLAFSVFNYANPVYWIKKWVIGGTVNIIISKSAMLIIDIVADETNKTYSKRIFDQEKALRTAEIENIINEIEQEGGE